METPVSILHKGDTMADIYTKWTACWGNAMSIREQTECRYAKDLTLRYPVRMCFDGCALRFHFSNLRGIEPVSFTAVLAKTLDDKESIDPDSVKAITVKGSEKITLMPGENVCSDDIAWPVKRNEYVTVSLYCEGFTDMNTGVLITGPLTRGWYSYGNYAASQQLPLDLTRKTGWFHFLETIDVLTEEKNHALICFGDSITAQDWPDYLAIRAEQLGYHDVSIIRRAISGTRILREYNSITYAAYGWKGEHRFLREMDTAGADTVLIQHGINDIIHPVGVENNPFRPWSDLPTAAEMAEGYDAFYIQPARKLGYRVYGGTLIPIHGWRTYAPFREELKNEFNHWLRTTDLLDGCADFDLAVRDPQKPEAFLPVYDSGDHLHPSKKGYEKMAEAVGEEILQ